MTQDVGLLFPMKALSVRQPWAWAIIHGGKDVENRSAPALNYMNLSNVDRIAIHAAKGMTREEYEEAEAFMSQRFGLAVPPARELLRGGIIGSVAVTGIVKYSASPWFFGPRGIALKNPEPCGFIPPVGALGLFEWRETNPSVVPPTPRWMLTERDASAAPTTIEFPL